jgi:hypothetical protein
MNPSLRTLAVLGCSLAALAGCKPLAELQRENLAELADSLRSRELPFAVPPGSRMDTALVDHEAKTLTLRLNDRFSAVPYRQENVARVYASIGSFLRPGFEDYRIRIETLGVALEDLIPNYYRAPEDRDRTRLGKPGPPRLAPVVERLSRPFRPLNGLDGRTIGLWHSHGWYYDQAADRWEWQRPRLFESVEDLGPMTIVLPYLVPMLEQAGANVYLPRERDIQTREVLVDNDSSGGSYRETSLDSLHSWASGMRPGFAIGSPPYKHHDNPFRTGTHRITLSDTLASATVQWVPDVPEDGEYMVSLSYQGSPANVNDAHYTVHHRGGHTEFRVNQQIGGSTWHYLGRFSFRKGAHPDSGSVTLTNQSVERGMLVSADVVRLGGGMGVIERNGSTSGRPKYVEGARYYLQYAGMPDTLVYSLNADTSDYKDDYQSRAEYLNYLAGAPRGPNANRMVPGLGIPVDLSLAFHTDAGISRGDTTIGTLLIYNLEGKDSARVFPDGMSRMANRDFADLLQSTLVEDIRALHDSSWNRRALRMADYSEATRPNMPAALLELLSHQSLVDMQYMQDPRFRFTVARAIYKAMGRFLSVQYAVPFVVQPLPVRSMAAEFTAEGGVRLSWRPTADSLEQSAWPDFYVVYTRMEDGGFDNGMRVEDTSVVIGPFLPGAIMSFRVTAVNSGGESFPSEILAVCRLGEENPTVMIVNGFTRVGGPSSIELSGFAGFADFLDRGVPDGYALNYTGAQYNFSPEARFRSNDAPGHGASYADMEATVIAGNTFDFSFAHGKAIRASGFSFVSASKAAVMDRTVGLGRYAVVDVILGEEREAPSPGLPGPSTRALPPALQTVLRAYADSGGALLVSGAHFGLDAYTQLPGDSSDTRFLAEVLHCGWVTDHASRTGELIPARGALLPDSLHLAFNVELSAHLYEVESPDAFTPLEPAAPLLRYRENLMVAGVACSGPQKSVALGFPFECVLGEEHRATLMIHILGFLTM